MTKQILPMIIYGKENYKAITHNHFKSIIYQSLPVSNVLYKETGGKYPVR